MKSSLLISQYRSLFANPPQNVLKVGLLSWSKQDQRRQYSDLSSHYSHFIRQHSDTRSVGKKLLLSPTEATRTLRKHEATFDVDFTCPIKYYDVNYLSSNAPSEDRSAQAKLVGSVIFLFGVFDGYVLRNNCFGTYF